VQAPGIEALGDRISRDLKRLTGAIALAALVVGGSMLEMSPLSGWRGLLSVTMLLTGVLGTLVISLGALRRRLGRR
jgi:ubiquinone biosynthesis protein